MYEFIGVIFAQVYTILWPKSALHKIQNSVVFKLIVWCMHNAWSGTLKMLPHFSDILLSLFNPTDTEAGPIMIITRSIPLLLMPWLCLSPGHPHHYAGGPRRPPPPHLHLRRSHDLAQASIPLGLTGRAWLQAGAQQAVIAVDPSFKSLGIDSRNVLNM